MVGGHATLHGDGQAAYRPPHHLAAATGAVGGGALGRRRRGDPGRHGPGPPGPGRPPRSTCWAPMVRVPRSATLSGERDGPAQTRAGEEPCCAGTPYLFINSLNDRPSNYGAHGRRCGCSYEISSKQERYEPCNHSACHITHPSHPLTRPIRTGTPDALAVCIVMAVWSVRLWNVSRRGCTSPSLPCP